MCLTFLIDWIQHSIRLSLIHFLTFFKLKHSFG